MAVQYEQPLFSVWTNCCLKACLWDVEDAVPYTSATSLAADEEAGGSNGGQGPPWSFKGGFKRGEIEIPPFGFLLLFDAKRRI